MIRLLTQFIKFGIVGLSNTIISYGVYAGLTYVGVPYVLASVIGFVVSVLNSFFWNNRFVFKKRWRAAESMVDACKDISCIRWNRIDFEQYFACAVR